jgi:ribosomal protein L32
MDIGSLLLLLALVIVVAAYIASPLRKPRDRRAVSKLDIELSRLLAERERVLDALAELDFDNDMGKVPDDLYPVQRELLLIRGADVLRLLDEQTFGQIEASGSETERTERVERAAKIRSTDEDPLEAMIAARRSKRALSSAQPAGKANFCPNCGSALQPGDRFCPSCGQQLS